MAAQPNVTVLEDWKNREFVETVEIGVRKCVDFLNNFHESAKYRLSVVDARLCTLERKLDFLEASLEHCDPSKRGAKPMAFVGSIFDPQTRKKLVAKNEQNAKENRQRKFSAHVVAPSKTKVPGRPIVNTQPQQQHQQPATVATVSSKPKPKPHAPPQPAQQPSSPQPESKPKPQPAAAAAAKAVHAQPPQPPPQQARPPPVQSANDDNNNNHSKPPPIPVQPPQPPQPQPQVVQQKQKQKPPPQPLQSPAKPPPSPVHPMAAAAAAAAVAKPPPPQPPQPPQPPAPGAAAQPPPPQPPAAAAQPPPPVVEPPSAEPGAAPPKPPASAAAAAASQIDITYVKEGDGPIPGASSAVEIEYSGFLQSGKQFITHREVIQLGKKQNIKGLEQAVIRIKVGSIIKLSIPSRLAYGARGAGNLIPPNSDLIFNLKLHRIVQQ